nr:hypothetical protein Iba_chr13aCG10140 [Ipomoea batatas]
MTFLLLSRELCLTAVYVTNESGPGTSVEIKNRKKMSTEKICSAGGSSDYLVLWFSSSHFDQLRLNDSDTLGQRLVDDMEDVVDALSLKMLIDECERLFSVFIADLNASHTPCDWE